MKAQRASRGTAPLILNIGARWSWVVNLPTLPLDRRNILWQLLDRRLAGPHSQFGCFGKREKHLAPAWIRRPDRPACSAVTILTVLPRLQHIWRVSNVWALQSAQIIFPSVRCDYLNILRKTGNFPLSCIVQFHRDGRTKWCPVCIAMQSNPDIAPLFAGRNLCPYIAHGREFIYCTKVNFCSQIFMGAISGWGGGALYRGLTADASRPAAGTVVGPEVTSSNQL